MLLYIVGYNFIWCLTVLLLFGIWSKKKGHDLTEIRGSLWESLLHNFVWVKGFYWHKRQNEEIQRRKMCQRWVRRYTLWLKSSCIADFWKLESTLRKWWLMPVVCGRGIPKVPAVKLSEGEYGNRRPFGQTWQLQDSCLWKTLVL